MRFSCGVIIFFFSSDACHEATGKKGSESHFDDITHCARSSAYLTRHVTAGTGRGIDKRVFFFFVGWGGHLSMH